MGRRIRIALSNGDVADAKRLHQKFADIFRLLDDIGWDERDDRLEYTLTVPAKPLRRMRRRCTTSEQRLGLEPQSG